MFVGDDLSTAFSGQTLLAGLSGGICYFIYGYLTRNEIAGITIVNGVIALLFYGVLLSIDYRIPQPWSSLLPASWTPHGYKKLDNEGPLI